MVGPQVPTQSQEDKPSPFAAMQAAAAGQALPPSADSAALPSAPAAPEAQAFLTDDSDDSGHESSGSDDIAMPKDKKSAPIVPYDFGGEEENEDEIASIAAKIAVKKQKIRPNGASISDEEDGGKKNMPGPGGVANPEPISDSDHDPRNIIPPAWQVSDSEETKRKKKKGPTWVKGIRLPKPEIISKS